MRDHRTLQGLTMIGALLVSSAACSDGGRTAVEPGTTANDERWVVVQDYLDQQAAWEEQAGDLRGILMTSGGNLEEGLRRVEEEHGARPDATAAVEAAQSIVAEGGPWTVEAAEFLIERSRDPLVMSETMGNAMTEALDAPDVGATRLRASEDGTWDALIAHVGPDWSVVEEYVEERSD